MTEKKKRKKKGDLKKTKLKFQPPAEKLTTGAAFLCSSLEKDRWQPARGGVKHSTPSVAPPTAAAHGRVLGVRKSRLVTHADRMGSVAQPAM